MLLVDDWRPAEVTVFQGLAPGTLPHRATLQALVKLPGDIVEFALSDDQRLARRMTGIGGFAWVPFNASSLPQLTLDAIGPLIVMFSTKAKVARQIETWRTGQPGPIVHVGVNGGGDLGLEALSMEVLAGYCRAALVTFNRRYPEEAIDNALDLVDRWRAPTPRRSPLVFGKHNVTAPNAMVLMSAGVLIGKGRQVASPPDRPDDTAFVEAITESTRAVVEMREKLGQALAFRMDPPRPGLILYAPALYKGLEETFRAGRDHAPPGFLEALRKISRQQTFAFVGDSESFAQPGFRAAFHMRGDELKAQAAAVGVRAASSLSAVLRLPPRVNRTAGAIAHLSAHLHNRRGPQPVKTARVFAGVQKALANAVSEDQLELIRRQRYGLKIVGDAPLEWLPVDGLPLGIRYDVSRINVTPGALTFGELATPQTLYLSPEAFEEFLVISSFGEDDDDLLIKNYLRDAVEIFAQNSSGRLRPQFVTVRSREELVAALNAFDGAIAVFDMHGEHRGDVGGLLIGDELLDVWSLRLQARIPPIVLLSACDTHPPDRSHATVANGFIHCGAIAVLATMLPVRADKAAMLVARLMLRAMEFSTASLRSGWALNWAKIVGGMLRMQLVTELTHALVLGGQISYEDMNPLILQGSEGINFDREDWFERFALAAKAVAAFDDATWGRFAEDALAASDVIRYVQVGNPEAIVVTSEALMMAVHDRAEAKQAAQI